MNAIHPSSRVAEIVTEHPASARLFTEHKIDYCCHGDVALGDACTARGLDVEELLFRIRAAASTSPSERTKSLTEASTPELIAHIISRHHTYLRRALPAIEPLAEKVARVHLRHQPSLDELLEEVRALRAALEPHLDDEEADLFPMLMSRKSSPTEIARRVAETRDEHQQVGRALEWIRALSDDFAIPDWACGSYRLLMNELLSLEEDTMRHVHLENHVLMPRFR
jgi:regulator of cell morphogenesis and NO signaling